MAAISVLVIIGACRLILLRSFRKEFGKWPSELSYVDIRVRLRELGQKLRDAKTKYNDYIKKNVEPENFDLVQEEFLLFQCSAAEYDIKHALKLARRFRIIPKSSKKHISLLKQLRTA